MPGSLTDSLHPLERLALASSLRSGCQEPNPWLHLGSGDCVDDLAKRGQLLAPRHDQTQRLHTSTCVTVMKCPLRDGTTELPSGLTIPRSLQGHNPNICRWLRP